MGEKLGWDELESLPIGKFETVPHYDPDSDTLSIFIDDDNSFRERIDRRLTVYRSMQTKKVVGCQIKHVSKIMSTIDGFHLGIESQGVTIGLLLMGIPLSDDDETARVQIIRYREVVRPIVERVGSTKVPELVGA